MSRWLNAFKENFYPESTRLLTDRTDTSFAWDENKALKLFQGAVKRVKQRYPPGAWQWAIEHRPELRAAVKEAEGRFNRAFSMKNTAECCQACNEYEQAFDVLFAEFNNNRALSADEAINAFGHCNVWELPADKAQELDEIYSGTRKWQAEV